MFSILDDDVNVRVRFGDEDRLRADAATYVDEHRALGEIIPRKPYLQSQYQWFERTTSRRESPAQDIRTSENLFLNLVLARAHHSMPETPEPALVPREFEPREKPKLRAERDVERRDIASQCARPCGAGRLKLAKFKFGVEVRVCAMACRTLLGQSPFRQGCDSPQSLVTAVR